MVARQKIDSTAAKERTKRNREGKERVMSIEFLLVTFPEDRQVKADGNNVGVTNHTLMLPADEYSISLSGDGYKPVSQDVVLAGTSVMKPKVIVFSVDGPPVRRGTKNG